MRRTKKSGDKEKLREVVSRQLRFEEKAFRERAEKYPTDLRFKYEHARRLFRFRKFDDAIPLFQQARNDPKARNSCAVYLGRCFLEKNLPVQSIEILAAAGTPPRDGEEQAHLHDEERLVHGGDVLTEAIERAKKEMDANPEIDVKVIAYTDLLCKDEDDEKENSRSSATMRP